MMDTAGLPRWGGLAKGSEDTDIVVVGIPYDGSAVYRKGAAGAPARIRELSAIMPPVTETGRSLAALRVVDLGDLDLGDAVESGWKRAATELRALPPKAFLTAIGGDHCSTIPVLAAQTARHPDCAVLWIDAHPDLCDFSRGGRWTCGCALRRGMEIADLKPGSIVIAGSRDYDLEELEFSRQAGIELISVRDLARDPQSAAALVADHLGSRPLHISFDIDVLDPAFAPGTEVPSAGGLSTRQALEFLEAVAARTHVVGLDVMEVSPPLDQTDITTLAALKIIFEIWGYVLL
ncbi:MAG TPA: agmatinase [Candidatus Dormibacteraeota bacterium]|nr:agmatinase [Candidatus Dormibacteraeota bacterium]